MTENIFLIELFRLLNEGGISYSVLRNFKSLPNNCNGSDLDIWVGKGYIHKFMCILQQTAKTTNSYLVSYTPNKNCPKYCYLSTEGGVQIDLFQEVIACKGKTLLNSDIILSNTILYNGIKVLDEKLGDILAFLKEILNNKKCDPKYISPLYNNKDFYDEEYLDKVLTAFTPSYRNRFCRAISNNRIESEINHLALQGRKDLGISTIGSLISTFPKAIRFIKPTGYTIAILGTDGSGKSFIINHITPILDEAFHKGIRYEHMRPNYIPSIAVLTGKRKRGEYAEVCSNPHASKPSGFFGSLVRLSYYWIDYTWGYFRKIYLDKTFKTHIWIFDRYYYDYYIDQRRAKINLPNWIIKLYGSFIPSPDLTLCLGGDPVKIYSRKPETSLEEVTRQTEALEQFMHAHGKTVWIDTTIPPKNSITEAMNAIICEMSRRFVI